MVHVIVGNSHNIKPLAIIYLAYADVVSQYLIPLTRLMMSFCCSLRTNWQDELIAVATVVVNLDVARRVGRKLVTGSYAFNLYVSLGSPSASTTLAGLRPRQPQLLIIRVHNEVHGPTSCTDNANLFGLETEWCLELDLCCNIFKCRRSSPSVGHMLWHIHVSTQPTLLESSFFCLVPKVHLTTHISQMVQSGQYIAPPRRETFQLV